MNRYPLTRDWPVSVSTAGPQVHGRVKPTYKRKGREFIPPFIPPDLPDLTFLRDRNGLIQPDGQRRSRQ
jgi:hypothetical protein